MPTKEREHFNNVIMPKFASMVKEGAVVYDIGVGAFQYNDYFKRVFFSSVDNDKGKNPDIVLDLERVLVNTDHDVDAVICHGVTEQCDDPYNLIRGISYICKTDALFLLGAISVGYPIYEMDRFRFTPRGIKDALTRHDFDVLEISTFEREAGVPSYIYAIAKKR